MVISTGKIFVYEDSEILCRETSGRGGMWVRVEGISRDRELGSSKNARANEILTTTRQRFCLNLAVIGLRDSELDFS